jgi:hypothetical protein
MEEGCEEHAAVGIVYHSFPALILGNSVLSCVIVDFVDRERDLRELGVDPGDIFLRGLGQDEDARVVGAWRLGDTGCEDKGNAEI